MAREGARVAVFDLDGGSNLSRIHAFDPAEWERLMRLNLSGCSAA